MDIPDAAPTAGIYTERNPEISLELYYNNVINIRPQPNVGNDETMEVDSGDSNLKYNMNHKKRGCALIINNEDFNPKTMMPTRNGSTTDAESIKSALEKLSFKVIVYKNETVKGMRQLFEDIGAMNHKDSDCFACVILSHGNDNDVIYGTDGTLTLDELIVPILPNNCKDLLGKPKLFFIQACRGTKLDRGVQQHDAKGSFESTQKIPLWADLLIAYSTVPGFYAWRNSVNGSWFIQSLSYIFNTYGDSLELQQMLTKVNHRVAYEYESKSGSSDMDEMKQMPCVASMLTKEVHFPIN